MLSVFIYPALLTPDVLDFIARTVRICAVGFLHLLLICPLLGSAIDRLMIALFEGSSRPWCRPLRVTAVSLLPDVLFLPVWFVMVFILSPSLHGWFAHGAQTACVGWYLFLRSCGFRAVHGMDGRTRSAWQ